MHRIVACRSSTRLMGIAVTASSFFSQSYSFAGKEESPRVRRQKVEVSERAVDEYVHSGSVVGLGTGSTVLFALTHLSELLSVGALENVRAVPCSELTKTKCIALGIPVVNLNDISHVDVIIDGADEVDLQLNIVKGGSGAFLREKMVTQAVSKHIIVCDETKLVKNLGTGHPLPVEVTPYSSEFTRRSLETLPSLQGCRALIRLGSTSSPTVDGFEPAVTDNGNYIVDLYFDHPIENVCEASRELDSFPGVVAHGLVCNRNDSHITVIVASDKGVRIAGEDGEKPWWVEQQTLAPIDRISLDNRIPPTPE